MTELAPFLLLAFLAGILLNFSPCVLPVVPLKLRLLLEEGGRSGRQRFASGAALLAGSLIFFTTLGFISVSLQWVWGSAMGAVEFRLGIAVILVLAGTLLLLDLSKIPLPQSLLQWSGRGALEGFVTGIVGGFLTLPCTGPMLGGVLAFSATQPSETVVALFFIIGAGMASPYLVLLAYPRWIPRGGMTGRFGLAIPRLFGVALIAGSIFYAKEFLPSFLTTFGVEWLVVGIFGAWAITTWRPGVPVLERGIANAFTALALITVILYGSQALSNAESIDWEVIDHSDLVADKLDKPAIINFTAEWCFNCKVLDRTVYANQDVIDEVDANLAAYEVDLTDFTEPAQQMLTDWGGVGMPYAVIIDKRGKIVNQFRDFFGSDEVIKSIHSIEDQ